MRNLGLALLFASMVLAPHLANAKKSHKKHGRSAPRALKLKAWKGSKRARAQQQAVPARDDDQLASAVVEARRTPPSTMTAAAPPPAAAPAPAHEASNPATQVFDDEVPGQRKK